MTAPRHAPPNPHRPVIHPRFPASLAPHITQLTGDEIRARYVVAADGMLRRALHSPPTLPGPLHWARRCWHLLRRRRLRNAPIRGRLLRRVVCGWLVLALLTAGCSVARRADQPRVEPIAAPTEIAPPQAEGLDGSAGEPAPHACAAVLKRGAPAHWTAKKFTWNDGGLPALDLCTLTVGRQPVEIGVTALPAQPTSLDRLARAAGFTEPATKLGSTANNLGADARSGDHGIVFRTNERIVRITSQGTLSPAELLTIAEAVRAVVPAVMRNARQSDAACQVSTAQAEQFIGALVQLRRDYRVNGALTCIWGTYDATVAIVESFYPDSIPEARRTPPPKPAPIGRPGYYLPDRGELVFRQGRRVVRVSGITDPARVVPMDTLIDIVEPLMPLFIR